VEAAVDVADFAVVDVEDDVVDEEVDVDVVACVDVDEDVDVDDGDVDGAADDVKGRYNEYVVE